MSPTRFLRDLVLVLAAAGLLVAGITRWVAMPWQIRGVSMTPTLEEGDRVLVDLWTLRRRQPVTGEIVVFTGPDGDDLVKRVAREPYPGDEPYPAPMLPRNSALESSYVVLGDNRAASSDSRDFGRVPRHRMRGLIVWRYWPPSRWGRIE